MSNTCPTCRNAIPTSALNLKGGTGHCAACDKTWRLADLHEQGPLGDIDTAAPPTECTIETSNGRTTVSASMAGGSNGGMVFFALFWNGLLSIFIFVAILTTWKQITGTYPFQFFAPGKNDFDSVNGVILLWAFLTPFMAVGAWTMSMAMLHLAGRLRITMDDREGHVWIGVGPIGRTRRFDPRRVTNVKLTETKWEMNGRRLPLIEIAGEKRLRFGTAMQDDRRRWVVAALKQSLFDGKSPLVPSPMLSLPESAYCPECREAIPRETVDADQRSIHCPGCHKLWYLDDLAAQMDRLDFSRIDTANPPPGCASRSTGRGMVYSASLRTIPNILLSLFVVLFWNGILSVFLVFQITDTCKHLGWTLPAWFPQSSGTSNPLIMTIGLWVFFTPFLAVGMGFVVMLLSCMFGGVRVRLDGNRGTASSGIGPLARRKRFEIDRVQGVYLKPSQTPDMDSERLLEIVIEIDGGAKPVRVGSMLPKRRKRWLAAAANEAIRSARSSTSQQRE